MLEGILKKKGWKQALAALALGVVIGPVSLSPREARAQASDPTSKAQQTQQAAAMATTSLEGVSGTVKPWVAGVSAAGRAAATARFLDGNALLKNGTFRDAAVKYREALAQWDHPGIHYNLALSLMTLDQPLETYEHLKASLRYGPAALDLDRYAHAKSYLNLVEKQLSYIDVSCNEPGATVRLDGRILFKSPGRYKGRLRAGPHTVAASKAGYSTAERSQEIGPGTTARFRLSLHSSDEVGEQRRRWPMWRPIAVTAGGVALIGAGVAFTLAAKGAAAELDQAVRTREECTTGCYPGSLGALKTRQVGYPVAAGISYGLGGIVLATGVTLLIMNRSVSFRREPDPAEKVARMTVIPVLGPEGAGLWLARHF